MINGEGIESSSPGNGFSVSTTTDSPADILFSNNSLLKFVDFFILGLCILILTWMLYDSVQRFKVKWIFPVFAILGSLLPFAIANMLQLSNPYYWLVSTVIIWLLYLFIRPDYTQEEFKMLESEQKIKEITRKFYERQLLCHDPFCPVCGLPVKDDFLICPNCFKELKYNCPQCGKLVEKSWSLCPYCKTKLRQGAANETSDF